MFARVWTGHWFWTLLFRGCFLGWSRRGRQRAFPLAGLTDQENLGHDLLYGRNDSGMNTGSPDGAPKNAGCVACHNNKGPGSPGDEPDQLYTDHAYHHLGLPPNYQIENFDPNNGDSGLSEHAIGADFPDMGDFVGHYKTPTLSNVDKRKNKTFIKAYMHNGYFKNLEDVVHFYNTSVALRDDVSCPPGTTAAQAIKKNCWPAPEFDTGNQAGNFGLIGNLGLTEEEEAALVAYLKTFSDEKTVKPPKPFKKEKSAKDKSKK